MINQHFLACLVIVWGMVGSVSALADDQALKDASSSGVGVQPAQVEAAVKPNDSGYFIVSDPLFEPLLSDQPALNITPYWGGNTKYRERYSSFAVKFAYRYVWDEQWSEIAPYSMAALGLPCDESIKYRVPTIESILPYATDVAPKIIDDKTANWILDPRWQDEYVRRAVELAREYRGKTDQLWALLAGDEMYESAAIKIPPMSLRYDQVNQADEEIRTKYGFGKYGMPESDTDADPFKRIAHRRWVIDQLESLFSRTHGAVKEVNPEIKLISPDFSGAAPMCDLGQLSNYFDLVMFQSWDIFEPLANQVSTGCDTKIIADLSTVPVSALVQNTIGRAQVPGIEDIRERYSQAYRNGADGITICAEEWYEFEIGHPRYNYPAKWRAMLEIADMAKTMRKVKLPTADSAVLLSEYTMYTFRWPQVTAEEHPQIYAIYTLLGPLVRSWFTFVSDRQLERAPLDVGQYKAVYIPLAKYESAEVLSRLEEYIRAGGTVICADPEAFSWNIDGQPLSSRWAEITGVSFGAARQGNVSAKTVKRPALRLDAACSFPAPGYSVAHLAENVKPLMEFADGTPAVLIRNYGKGRVIQFTSNPLAVSPTLSSPMINLFRQLQRAVGASVGHDVWRFKLPPLKTKLQWPPVAPAGTVCLTNNDVVMEGAAALHGSANQAIGGTYTVRALDDDSVIEGPVAFDVGKLTNRWLAYQTRREFREPDPAKWTLTLDRPASATFDLGKSYPLGRIVLFYSGSLPRTTIQASSDGHDWISLGAWPGHAAGMDICDASLELTGNYRYLKLNFSAPESSGDRGILSEVEIWSDVKSERGNSTNRVDTNIVIAPIAPSPGDYQAAYPCLARLSDGRLLCVYSAYADAKGDRVVVKGIFSSDQGKSWSEPVTLIDTYPELDCDPAIVVMGQTILVTSTTVPPTHAQFITTSRTMAVRSQDNGQSWSGQYEIPMPYRYTSGKINNGLFFPDGTAMFGYAWDSQLQKQHKLDTEGEEVVVVGLMISKDKGKTWSKGPELTTHIEKNDGAVHAISGMDEPAIVICPDGSLYMLAR
ncbi:MAG: exo-alpha-sialidase, partial [Phycisphaerales bacterium]|nr:exo-alpha-sialidase [Phycisphaerales bacterium]